MKITFIILLFILLNNQVAIASPDNKTVYLKAPAIAGSGCSANQYRYDLSENGRILNIAFKNYNAKSVNKSCNIALPIHVPAGFQVSLLDISFTGFIKGKAEFRRSYFFAGERSQALKTDLQSQKGKKYQIHDTPNHWSQCGHDVNLRINTRIRAKGAHSSISVDNNGFSFRITYRVC